LGRALFGTSPVTIYPTDQFSVDAEVFMKVKASAQQTTAVRAALISDRDIQSVHHISKTDAYAIYKKDFADQPALVESTRPSDLPESFRIFVKPGRSVAEVVRRYAHLAGVDIVITPITRQLFDPAAGPAPYGNVVSPCSQP
jgi:cell division protein FtsX